ncbi:hypothetical protein [Methanolobus vulcani]|nr:hypothetical protein [Methanolobus vulcani]
MGINVEAEWLTPSVYIVEQSGSPHCGYSPHIMIFRSRMSKKRKSRGK